jgi:hypothetical protein
MNLKLKDVIQELKKYNVELDTNIKKIVKIDNEIVFETDEVVTIPIINNEDIDVGVRKSKKYNN